VHPILRELIEDLEKNYPDRASMLEGKSEIERERYLSKLELIEYIKLRVKNDSK
jgi:hypothetical protein